VQVGVPTGGEAMMQITRPLPHEQQALSPAAPAWAHAALAQQILPPLMRVGWDRTIMQVNEAPVRIGVLDIFSGDLKELLTIPTGTQVLGFGFSDDASQFALTLTNIEDRFTTRQQLDGALLTSLVYQDVTGQLPPTANPIYTNNALLNFDTATGAVRELRPDDDEALLGLPIWSPDGRTLAVLMLHGARVPGRANPIFTFQFTERVSYRFYDAELRELNRIDTPELSSLEGASARWISPDELLFQGTNATNRNVYYHNRASGELTNVTAGQIGFNNIAAVSRPTGTIVYGHQSVTEPTGIYTMQLDGSAIQRVTWDNYEVQEFSQTAQYPVSFTLNSGAVREGVLVLPAEVSFPPQDVPIIVWQEGGPGPAMLNRWLTNVENPYGLLPNFGFGLLIVPLAGRRGYDAATYNALAADQNIGQIDVDEAAEIVRQMIALGWTSVGKIGVTGCSYGGYFTLQSLARHPDLYSAGNAQCALTDWFVEWSRGFDRLGQYLQGRPPYEAVEEYRRDSPFYNAAAINAPLLTFHGEDDFLPVALNENLHAQLAGKGLEVRFVKFLEEGHGLVDAASQLYAAQEQIAWFRQHLAP
jgi:dipeptidyl aminopeptidase/acylaminoacyl peptidase